MGGGGGGEWWKRSGVGPACRVGEECARRARAGEKEDRTAQESKPDPSSNASVRSYGFSLERQIVTVAGRENRDRYPRARYCIYRSCYHLASERARAMHHRSRLL